MFLSNTVGRVAEGIPRPTCNQNHCLDKLLVHPGVRRKCTDAVPWCKQDSGYTIHFRMVGNNNNLMSAVHDGTVSQCLLQIVICEPMLQTDPTCAHKYFVRAYFDQRLLGDMSNKG